MIKTIKTKTLGDFTYDTVIMDELLGQGDIRSQYDAMQPALKEFYIVSLIREGVYQKYIDETRKEKANDPQNR